MSDIPPRLRLLLTVAAIGGFIFISMGSLAGNGQHTVSLDKIVHGVGYGLLGMLVVMGLPPAWYIPALLAISGAGVGLEFAQKAVMPSRKFEVMDIWANLCGLLVGMCAGFFVRAVWGYVQKEMNDLALRKNLFRFPDASTIFSEGDLSDCFYVIIQGNVEIRCSNASGQSDILATLGPGDLLGEMGAIEAEPRSATAMAIRPVSLYRINSSDLHPIPGESVHPAMAVARALSTRLRQANQRLLAISPHGGSAEVTGSGAALP